MNKLYYLSLKLGTFVNVENSVKYGYFRREDVVDNFKRMIYLQSSGRELHNNFWRNPYKL